MARGVLRGSAMRRLLHVGVLGALLATSVARAQDPPNDVTPPVLETFVEASFPDGTAARSAVVRLILEIDAEGRVTRATVKDGAGEAFDAAAVAAAERFVFKPATRAGRAIPSKIVYEYSFARAEPSPPPPAPPPAPRVGVLRGVVRSTTGEGPVAGARVTVTRADDAQRSVRAVSGPDGADRKSVV